MASLIEKEETFSPVLLLKLGGDNYGEVTCFISPDSPAPLWLFPPEIVDDCRLLLLENDGIFLYSHRKLFTVFSPAGQSGYHLAATCYLRLTLKYTLSV